MAEALALPEFDAAWLESEDAWAFVEDEPIEPDDGMPDDVETISFAWCPTGPGGGQDNSCGSGGGASASDEKLNAAVKKWVDAETTLDELVAKKNETLKAIAAEKAKGADANQTTINGAYQQSSKLNKAIKPAKELADKANEELAAAKAEQDEQAAKDAKEFGEKAATAKQEQQAADNAEAVKAFAKNEDKVAQLHAQKQDVMKQIAQAKKDGDQSKVNSLYQKSSKLNKQIKATQEGKIEITKHAETKATADDIKSPASSSSSVASQKISLQGAVKNHQTDYEGHKLAGNEAKAAESLALKQKAMSDLHELNTKGYIGPAYHQQIKTLDAEIAALKTTQGKAKDYAETVATSKAIHEKQLKQIEIKQLQAAAKAAKAVTTPAAVKQAVDTAQYVEESCCVDDAVIANPAHSHPILNAAYGDIQSQISGNGLTAVKGYTGNGYDPINKALWKNAGDLNTAAASSHVQASTINKIKAMDKAFEVAKRMPEDIVVHRGTGDGYGFEKLKSGDEFVAHGYSSTTVASSIANRSVQLRIRVPKGAKAMYVPSISHHPSEDEIILPRNSKFRVEGVKIKLSPNGLHKTRIIQVAMLPDG